MEDVWTPTLDSHSTTEPKPELLSAVSTINKICHRRKMYASLFSKKEDVIDGIDLYENNL